MKSIADLLSTYKPVLIAESFGDSSNEDKMELFQIIENLGYDIYYFEDFDVESSTQKLADKKTCYNGNKQ